jgi:histidine triad (HIT) family protein
MFDVMCIFCQIIRGDEPASQVYSDDRVVAFLDIHPVNPGHTLVVPRHHAASLADLDETAGGRLFAVAMRVAAALRSSNLQCEGVNYLLADGAPAGQEVPHVHLHVFPRYRGDGFGLRFPAHYGRRGRQELDAVAVELRQVLEA